ncbi:MAG: metal-dependent hydrolase [Chloroflexi bacterium]|nr:metal-dependent hydrolase [Chloroflexota bacterium]
MAQAGLHGIVGVAVRKWMPKKEWLLLGVVLGSLFPDLDYIAVAFAVMMQQSAAGLQYTFTHSIFTILVVVLLFHLISLATKNNKWSNLGLGFGIGILLHILLDLVIWFKGVELFWPFHYELNFWSWLVVPNWLDILLRAGEFLAFGLYFTLLAFVAAKQKTNEDYAPKLRSWANSQYALFFLFTFLFFFPQKNTMAIYSALYLLALFFAIIITLRMKQTIEQSTNKSK